MTRKPLLSMLLVALIALFTAGSVLAAQPAPQETETPDLPTSPRDADEPDGPGQGDDIMPGEDATLPGTSDDDGLLTGDNQVVEEEFERVALLIQTVSDDRDFAESTIDTATVDALIENAESLLNDARTALNGGNYRQAQGLAKAAADTAKAARNLMEAGMADYGFPSQQAQASRELVNVYYAVQEVTGQSANLSTVDVSLYVTTAQDLYGEAYDLYNDGTYEQAMQTAHIAGQLGRIAYAIQEVNGQVSGPGGPGLGGPGMGGPGGPGLGGPGLEGDDASNQTPLTVPAPEF
ncbi:MAG: hypothetical protein H0V37_02875 [Chloroflexia bacterium]|nr:hypothetical protein [Chloroflexia bacterium]